MTGARSGTGISVQRYNRLRRIGFAEKKGFETRVELRGGEEERR
jgi:hypothetical protein